MDIATCCVAERQIQISEPCVEYFTRACLVFAPVHHPMQDWGLVTTRGSQNDAATSAVAQFWGRVHAKVQLEIVRRRVLRPRRGSGNDRNCVGVPAPQRVVRARLPDCLIIGPNHRRRISSALGVGFSQLTPIDPSSSRQSSGLLRPCRRLCRSARRRSLARTHRLGWI